MYQWHTEFVKTYINWTVFINTCWTRLITDDTILLKWKTFTCMGLSHLLTTSRESIFLPLLSTILPALSGKLSPGLTSRGAFTPSYNIIIIQSVFTPSYNIVIIQSAFTPSYNIVIIQSAFTPSSNIVIIQRHVILWNTSMMVQSVQHVPKLRVWLQLMLVPVTVNEYNTYTLTLIMLNTFNWLLGYNKNTTLNFKCTS